ncbi:MAG: TonB-dependent receptor [Deltaproteobacteria bacterium]|nr:TonB-dependent receptor [Deltaproteobacteria bacterium]
MSRTAPRGRGRQRRALALAPILALCAGPAAAEPAADAEADQMPVDPPEIVAAPWLVLSGAGDLAAGLAARSAALAGDGSQFTLDGLADRRWLVTRDRMRLFGPTDGGLSSAALPLALFLDERIAVQAGPGPGPDGDAALGGAVAIERARRRQPAGAQAATEVRVGSTTRSRAALAAGSDSGLLAADVAAFADRDQARVAAADALRASGARGRLALGLASQAQLGLECEATALAAGAARQQRSLLRFDSTLSLQPGQVLRLDLVRQGLIDRPGGGSDGTALDETALRAGYQGQLVVGHFVDLAVTGGVQSARRPATAISVASPHRAAAAIVASDDWRIRPKLWLRASGSLGFDDLVGGLVAGRVALRYEPARAVVLRGVVGTGQRAPTLEERAYASGALSGPELDHVPTLRPEESRGYRLSAGFEPRSDGFARITLLRTDLNDLIEPIAEREESLSDLRRYRNIGRLHVQGLAFDLVALRLAGGIGVDLAYRWLFDARDDRTGRPLANRPEHLANVLVRWELAALGTQLFVHTRLLREHVGAADGSLAPLAAVDAGMQLAVLDALDVVIAVDNAAGSAGRPAMPLPERAARVALRVRSGGW